MNNTNIAFHYNGGGDSSYAAKLDDASSVIRGTKVPATPKAKS